MLLLHCRVYSHVCGNLKLANFRLMMNCFSPVQSGQNMIGLVRGRAIKFTIFWSGSGQKITWHYRVELLKTLPDRTLITIHQGFPTCGPRTACGPQGNFMWPAKEPNWNRQMLSCCIYWIKRIKITESLYFHSTFKGLLIFYVFFFFFFFFFSQLW